VVPDYEEPKANLPERRPPEQPPSQRGHGAEEEGTPSLHLVYDMVKTGIDMQFKISERLDAKARNYLAAAATVYAVAQGLVLNSDVRNRIGGRADELEVLAVIAAATLLASLVATLFAIRSRAEKEIPSETLRALAKSAYEEDSTTDANAVNLLIGVLDRRKVQNAARNRALTVVMWTAGFATLVSCLELILAVEALL